MHRTSHLLLPAFTVLSLGAASCLMEEAKSMEHPVLATDAGSKARGAAGGRAAAQMNKDPKKPVDAGTETPGDVAVEPPPANDKAEPIKRVCDPIDKLDLLLMVDNPNSMAGEQESLRVAFPSLIRALTTGARFEGDPKPFSPITDLHVGVVSSDMGIPGVELPPTCHADGGDDGRLQHTPHGEKCQPQYPLWLNFGSGADSTKNATELVDSFNCIASLGTGGCGFEEQLEAPFKALMPKVLRDENGKVTTSPYRFLAQTEPGTWGRGDSPAAEGGNLGFLRDALDTKPSLVAIVVVTDEDDCSVNNTEHLKPSNQLPEGSKYRQQDINLRCYYNKQFLYDLKTRYFQGFRSLQPGFEDRVLFGAITGVPMDLVSPEVLAGVDFESDDSATRSAFYNTILADSRMQEVIDPMTMPGSGLGNFTPSCVRKVGVDAQPATAFSATSHRGAGQTVRQKWNGAVHLPR